MDDYKLLITQIFEDRIDDACPMTTTVVGFDSLSQAERAFTKIELTYPTRGIETVVVKLY